MVVDPRLGPFSDGAPSAGAPSGAIGGAPSVAPRLAPHLRAPPRQAPPAPIRNRRGPLRPATPPNLTRSKAATAPICSGVRRCAKARHIAGSADRLAQIAVGRPPLVLEALGPFGHPFDVVYAARERRTDCCQWRVPYTPWPWAPWQPWQLAAATT